MLHCTRFRGHALLLLMLAPCLLGLGIEVRHHRTFLARLAFPLIGLAAGGLHPSPSLSATAVPNRVVWRLWRWSIRKVMLKLIFILLCSYDQLLSRRQVPSGAGVLCAGGVFAGYGAKTV